jgi:hypothetical protein
MSPWKGEESYAPFRREWCFLSPWKGEESFVPLEEAFMGRFLGVETTADWTASEPNPQVGSLVRDRALPPPNLPPLGGGAKLPPHRGGLRGGEVRP